MRGRLDFSVLDIFVQSGTLAFIELAVFVQVILFQYFLWRWAVRSARAAWPAETAGTRTRADEFIGSQFTVAILVELRQGC